jgi:hypothetical protein
MNGVKLEVQWSPVHPNKFITWGTEIFLYEVVPIKDAQNSSSKDYNLRFGFLQNGMFI